MRSPASSLAALVVALAFTGCGATTLAKVPPTPKNAQPCTPTDQEQYTYRPARLQLLLPCLRVTGTIIQSTAEADGDYHINVRLDPPYEDLLTDGNDFEDGLLIVEPVCQFPPLQAEAIRLCAADPDPLSGGLPAVGDHVFLEGRWVLDLQHHAWAELHPLYRWGKVL